MVGSVSTFYGCSIAEHGFDIYRLILHVCDVTLLCIIAMSIANAG